MKNKKFLKVFSSAMAVSLVVAGCSTGSSSSKKEENKTVEFPKSVSNEGTAVDSTLKIGLVQPTPLLNTFNPIFDVSSAQLDVANAAFGSTYASDSYDRFKENDENTPVKFSLNKEAKEVTLTVHKDLKWSNGKPVTAKDIVATYELLGNPDYKKNQRYSPDYNVVEGMAEYHSGKADKISGLVEKDEKTVVVKLKEVTPSVMWGTGMLYHFLNAEQVAEASKDFEKFSESELMTKPLSYGPYQIDQVIKGEAVSLKQNEHFFKKDQVKTKKVEFKRVPSAQLSSTIKAGEVDLVSQVTPEVWNSTKDLSNGKYVAEPERYLSFVGFKLGKFDSDKNEVVVNPNAKAADPKLREAFGWAVDWDRINSTLHEGLSKTPTGSGLYPAAFEYIQDGTNKDKFTFDPEKAKKLLDEAGFKDTNGDGLREDKNGKELKFNFAIRNTGQTLDQPLADTFLKSWKDVGLNVQLADGKLMSQDDFRERVLTGDDENIDIFQSAIGFGSNPDPNSGMMSPGDTFNANRYTDNDIKEALKGFSSSELFNDEALKAKHKEFDKLVKSKNVFLPYRWRDDLTWVNNRIKNYDLDKLSSGEQKLYQLELTADKPAQG